MKDTVMILMSLSLLTACSSGSGSNTGGTSAADVDSGSSSDAAAQDAVSVDDALEETAASDVNTSETTGDDIPEDAAATADTAPEPSDAAPPQDAPTPDAEPAKPKPTEYPPIEGQYETWIGDWQMAPGKEQTKCVIKKLDNPEAIWVTGIHSKLDSGSHHMIVYKTGDTEEQTEPFECDPFTETLTGKAFPLLITQVSDESLVMPPGVAVKFEPYQAIRIEAHFLNYFPEEITAHGEVSFDTILEEDVWSEADMLFYGDVGFELPPNQEHQTNWSFLTVAEDVEVFAMTGHTHQFGTNVEVYYADGVEDDSTPVYPLEQPFQWDESPVTQYDPPLKFNGSNGLRFRCSWDNPTDEKIGFGESANQEMCFVWAYYYPSAGYQVCVDIKGLNLNIPGLEDSVCCPGNFVCDLIPGFL